MMECSNWIRVMRGGTPTDNHRHCHWLFYTQMQQILIQVSAVLNFGGLVGIAESGVGSNSVRLVTDSLMKLWLRLRIRGMGMIRLRLW